MKLQVFSVYDKVAQAYITPFFLPSIPQAQRAIGDCYNNPEHQFSLHPDHYSLHHLGEFCDITGRIDRFEDSNIIPVLIENGGRSDEISNEPQVQ